jgi:prevent-host-death family protein
MAAILAALASPAPACLCTHVSAELSIRALRGELAAAVRRAGQGERIVVTVGGRPTALLSPVGEQAPDLARLVASGAVIPPRRRIETWRPPAAVAVWSGVRLDRALAELRG